MTASDYILYIRWIYSMNNYKWYAGAIIFPLVGLFMFWIPTIYMSYISKTITNDDKNLNQKKMFIMGFLDSTNSIIATFAIPFLSVPLMTILDKSSLPITMLCSYIWLKRRYYKSHYLGAFLTIYGILLPLIMWRGNVIANPFWVSMYILSIIPGSISYCYKEKWMKLTDVSLWWMNAWVSLWQVLVGLLTLPIILIPGLTVAHTPNISIIDYLLAATKCQFLGINTLDGDNCEFASIWMISYQTICTIVNIMMLVIMKDSSSVMFLVINTIKTPITAWLGSYASIAGKAASPVTTADLMSFVMLLVAGGVYYYKKEISLDPNITGHQGIPSPTRYNDLGNPLMDPSDTNFKKL
jgi:uncharacterized membrane protein